jgi:outer membrane protein OmpA-like peptidoglycan-associated protein
MGHINMKSNILIVCLCFFAITGCVAIQDNIQGNLTKSYESEYHRTVKASSDTLKHLKIPVTEELSDGLKTVINAKRFDGTPVTIEVVRVKQNLTEVLVRTGKGFVLDKRVSTQIHEFIGESLKKQTEQRTTEKDLDEGAIEKAITVESINEPEEQIQNHRPAKLTEIYTDSVFIIYFDQDSNELTEKAKEKLDRVVEIIVKNPNVEITLNGYTDSYGPPSYNKVVSESRANMVKAYLIGKGIDPSKVKTVGHGAQKFLASNRTKEGRRFNRRVEIEVSSPITK